MPSHPIELNQFSAIFQILLAFYLGNAVSEKFNHFFSIEENFKKFIETSNVLIKQEKGIAQLDNALVDVKKHLFEEDINRFKIEKYKINVDLLHIKIYRTYNRYFSPNNYPNYEFNNKGNLQNCLKPFYLFFGMYTLCILILSGYIESWSRTANLTYLNLTSFLALLFLFYRIYVIRKPKCKYWGTVRAFFFSFILISIILLPSSLLESNKYIIGDSLLQKVFKLDHHDLQIIIAFWIALSVLIVHICIILFISIRIFWLKRQLTKAYGLDFIPKLYQTMIGTRPSSSDIQILN